MHTLWHNDSEVEAVSIQKLAVGTEASKHVPAVRYYSVPELSQLRNRQCPGQT